MTWKGIAAVSTVVLLLGACGSSGGTPEPDAAGTQKPSDSTADKTPRGSGASTGSRQECRADCAPGFEVTTFTGERFALAQHHGKVVVLNFWESW